MKKIFLIRFIPLLVAFLLHASSAVAVESVDDVPNVQLVDRTRHVSDPDDIIPASDEALINGI